MVACNGNEDAGRHDCGRFVKSHAPPHAAAVRLAPCGRW